MRRRAATWRLVSCLVLLPVSMLAAGCAADGNGSAPSAAVARIGTPVTDAVWSPRTGAIFALAAGRTAITRITPRPAGAPDDRWPQAVSAAMPDAARNIVVDAAGDDNVYVPQSAAGRVSVISEHTLRPVGSLAAGAAPSYLATDSGSDHLLVLDGGGSLVTPVDLHTGVALAPQPVTARADAVVEGAKRGRRIDFYVAGENGIAHFKWKLGSITEDGRLPLPAAEAAGDVTKSSRLYVAVHDSDRLVAVDVRPGGSGLAVVASMNLDGPARAVAADEGRVYAVTDRTLYVLAANSFEGYADGTFTVMARIDLRAALSGTSAASARVNGIVPGSSRVYLTLAGVPAVVSIAKPPL